MGLTRAELTAMGLGPADQVSPTDTPILDRGSIAIGERAEVSVEADT
jgi:hypothetical protein